jgi:hypothetical protein
MDRPPSKEYGICSMNDLNLFNGMSSAGGTEKTFLNSWAASLRGGTNEPPWRSPKILNSEFSVNL